MSGGVKIKLSRPIEAHGETLHELELGEIDLGALDNVNLVITQDGSIRINLGDLHRLIAGMAGIPPSSARRILVRDALAVKEKLSDFLGVSLQIGGK